MAMSDARARTGNDSSRGNNASRGRVRADQPPATVLAAWPDHPPLAAHVNGCDDCLGWLLMYMSSMVMAKAHREA